MRVLSHAEIRERLELANFEVTEMEPDDGAARNDTLLEVVTHDFAEAHALEKTLDALAAEYELLPTDGPDCSSLVVYLNETG